MTTLNTVHPVVAVKSYAVNYFNHVFGKLSAKFDYPTMGEFTIKCEADNFAQAVLSSFYVQGMSAEDALALAKEKCTFENFVLITHQRIDHLTQFLNTSDKNAHAKYLDSLSNVPYNC